MLDRLLSSPAKLRKRVSQATYFVSHLPDHARYLHVLRAARRRGVASQDMLVDLKYLGIYLADVLDVATRRDILSFHYSFLARKIATVEQGRRWTRGAAIWQWHDEPTGHRFAIHLEASILSQMEGETQLRFVMNEDTLFTLTFCFLHGASIGVPPEAVMFIGGVQGSSNRRQEIRIAAKAVGEIVPTAVLLIAAKAIAQAFGVDYVVGISQESHAAVAYAREKISLSYDAMWLDAGAIRTGDAYFTIAPALEKPLSDIRTDRRSRTRRKRMLKTEVGEQIRLNVMGLFMAESAAPTAITSPLPTHVAVPRELAEAPAAFDPAAPRPTE